MRQLQMKVPRNLEEAGPLGEVGKQLSGPVLVNTDYLVQMDDHGPSSADLAAAFLQRFCFQYKVSNEGPEPESLSFRLAEESEWSDLSSCCAP